MVPGWGYDHIVALEGTVRARAAMPRRLRENILRSAADAVVCGRLQVAKPEWVEEGVLDTCTSMKAAWRCLMEVAELTATKDWEGLGARIPKMRHTRRWMFVLFSMRKQGVPISP